MFVTIQMTQVSTVNLLLFVFRIHRAGDTIRGGGDRDAEEVGKGKKERRKGQRLTHAGGRKENEMKRDSDKSDETQD